MVGPLRPYERRFARQARASLSATKRDSGSAPTPVVSATASNRRGLSDSRRAVVPRHGGRLSRRGADPSPASTHMAHCPRVGSRDGEEASDARSGAQHAGPGRSRPGVCATCWRAVAPEYRRCLQCQDTHTYSDRLADVVVPIALAVKREQLAHELWHYKYDDDARAREWLEVRLAAVLWRFLADHEACVARACGSDGFGVVTTVPGTRSGGAEHPLVRMVGSTVGHTRQRFQRLLERRRDAARTSTSPSTWQPPRSDSHRARSTSVAVAIAAVGPSCLGSRHDGPSASRQRERRPDQG